MKSTNIIIIGAGATGLMAAYSLAKAGKKVTILEARNRIGGRIHTINNDLHFKYAELGAEFIHGDLPVTLDLLKEAGIKSTPTYFEMWRYKNGRFEESETNVEGWDQLLETLDELQQDMPIHDFLQQYFSEEKYAAMRMQIEGFVNGYDTADARDASSFALRNEWKNEDDDAQHRIEGGYIALINYLADSCRNNGSEILLNKAIKEVNWSKGRAIVQTTGNATYEAAKLIIAMPLGVLQTSVDQQGAVKFQPSLGAHAKAIHAIGFGSVIKILLEFEEAFWEQNETLKSSDADASATRFFTGGETIPSFWTQSPSDKPVLTGWLGGPPALSKKDMSEEALMRAALLSLSHIFNISEESLRVELQTWHVANWPAKIYTRGSYAYDKVESTEARKILNQPVEETIFFAGEYLYEGAAMGTVEAALTSGRDVAERVLR